MDEQDLVRMNSVMRHTLRNFASGIKTAMSILASESDGVLPSRCMEYFPLIINECNRLDCITKRWNLIFDPVPQGCCETAECVLEKCMGEVHGNFPTANILLETDRLDGYAAVKNSEALRIALKEIVENAIEADARKEIKIACSLESGFLKFRIEDCGPGVSSENRDEIFQPFHTTKSSHIGIGLTIAKRLITETGGKISAENNAHGGLAVEFMVPSAGQERI